MNECCACCAAAVKSAGLTSRGIEFANCLLSFCTQFEFFELVPLFFFSGHFLELSILVLQLFGRLLVRSCEFCMQSLHLVLQHLLEVMCLVRAFRRSMLNCDALINVCRVNQR